MKLTETIRGYMNREVYGAAGDEVKLITEYGNVLIVENEKGVRFPVKKELVLNDAPGPILEVAKVADSDTKPITNQLPAKTSKKSKPAAKNENLLF